MAKLRSDLTRFALEVPHLAHQALKQTAEDIADLTSQLVPVDTGALRDSIEAREIDETTYHVGGTVEYFPYVEFGTSVSGAQPSLVPAFKQAEDTFKKRLKDAIENGAK